MAKNNDIAIRVENVSKTFKLPHEKHTSLKGAFLNKVKQKKGYEIQEALKDVSFEVKKGEFFGIVGRNGSGKSTLLKCMAGVYTPNKGKIHINGKLVPFIELGVGFNPELSGRDNVYLNGALLGFSRRQMEGMYDEIVEFAELEQFMDQKLKNYSSGMQVRLAFSIAIRAKGDILLLDEVLAVGDSAFQQKCIDYFSTLKRNNQTIILVTHSMPAVERFCDRAMLLEDAKIKAIGESKYIASLYEELFIDDQNKNFEQTRADSTTSRDDVDIQVRVKQANKEVRAVRARKEFTISTLIKPNVEMGELNLGINIRNDQGTIVFSSDTRSVLGLIHLKKGIETEVLYDIENSYTNGTYTIDIHLVDETVPSKVVYRSQKITELAIKGITEHSHSLFHPKFKVTVNEE